MSKEKLARRKAAGDDPTAKTQSNMTSAGAPPPQPMPMSEQGKGNLMNNPQIGQSMGNGMPSPGSMSGVNLYPYGDGGVPVKDGRMGAIGFVPNSNKPQNQVAGRGMNQQPYGTLPSPGDETARMMEPMYQAQQAGERAQRLYSAGANGKKEGAMPSYQVGPMGLLGTPVETNAQGMVNPGQVPGSQPQQMFSTLGLQGMPDAQVAVQPPGTNKQVVNKKGKRVQ